MSEPVSLETEWHFAEESIGFAEKAIRDAFAKWTRLAGRAGTPAAIRALARQRAAELDEVLTRLHAVAVGEENDFNPGPLLTP